jgi:adiponectin receptor
MASANRLRVLPNRPDARKERALQNTTLQPGSEQAGYPDLLGFDDMPEWFQHDNNKWIIRGYRPISNSAHKSFCSWFYRHNETVNIYSHLIPAIVFFVGEWYLLRYLAGRYENWTTTDAATFSFFMLSATTCYAFSTLYHTLMNHSRLVDRFCHRLDMLGIGIFIVGDIILGIHVLFWCETTIRNVYWFMVSQSGVLGLFRSKSGTWS